MKELNLQFQKDHVKMMVEYGNGKPRYAFEWENRGLSVTASANEDEKRIEASYTVRF